MSFSIDRTTAEWLVDLLEKCDPKESGTWRFDLASEIRQEFGMVTLEREKSYIKELQKDAPDENQD